jgi:hypothetical protein
MRRHVKQNVVIAVVASFFLALPAAHAGKPGDVTNDGHVNVLDAVRTLQLLVKNPGGNSASFSGDANGDGRIGIEEVIYALQTEARLRDHPVMSFIGNKSADEGGALTFTISASDPEGQALTFSVSNLPEGAAFDAETRTFSWAPAYSQGGTYKVTFTVTDAEGYSTSEVVTITVNDQTPLLTASAYFPLQVGNWWDYYEGGTGSVLRSSVPHTKSIGGYTTYAVQYAQGDKEYYTSDSIGLTLYGVYLVEPEYTGDIFFNSPLLLAPYNAPLGSLEYVSNSSYPLTVDVYPYGYVTVDITARTNILAIEDVITQNRVLRDCIKVSVQMTQVIRETGEVFESETTYYWFYKGVGVVKQTDTLTSVTIKESYVNGVSDTY